MDEPFGALDPLTRAELQGEFQASSMAFENNRLRNARFAGSVAAGYANRPTGSGQIWWCLHARGIFARARTTGSRLRGTLEAREPKPQNRLEG